MSELIGTLYIDDAQEDILYPRTKTTAVVNDKGIPLEDELQEMNNAIQNMGTTGIPVNKITEISFNEAPTTCISTADPSANQYDNYQFSFFNVLKISDSRYFLYYTCFGQNDDKSSSSYKHLALAYSSDGTTWTRGIPSGITAPVSGTNLIFRNSVFEHHVFKVLDPSYPYRLICNYGVGNRDRIRLYKSADAVNFQLVRDVIMGDYDSQMTAIDRGGIVKVYLRLRTATASSPRGNRQIGYFIMDYDGNLIAPPTLAFNAESLYNASAMPIDTNRDILFPTHYDADADTQDLRCYIIDNNGVTQVKIDTSKILPSTYQTFYASPRGIVDIEGELYLFYMARTKQHDSTGGVSYILKAKIKYKTVGVPLNVSA